MGISVTRSTKSPWRRIKGEVSASQALVVIEEPNTTGAMEIIVAAKTASKAISFHYSLLNENGQLKSRVFSKTGTCNIDIDESINLGNIEVTLTNNEASTAQYELVVLRLLS
jgi:hypothetical protein